MKFTVMFKDPDALHESLDEAAKKHAASIAGLSPREREAVAGTRREELGELCGTWFEYGEYLEVEIDTEAKTATVLPVKR
jgi:hypothetical protein